MYNYDTNYIVSTYIALHYVALHCICCIVLWSV